MWMRDTRRVGYHHPPGRSDLHSNELMLLLMWLGLHNKERSSHAIFFSIVKCIALFSNPFSVKSPHLCRNCKKSVGQILSSIVLTCRKIKGFYTVIYYMTPKIWSQVYIMWDKMVVCNTTVVNIFIHLSLTSAPLSCFSKNIMLFSKISETDKVYKHFNTNTIEFTKWGLKITK